MSGMTVWRERTVLASRFSRTMERVRREEPTMVVRSARLLFFSETWALGVSPAQFLSAHRATWRKASRSSRSSGSSRQESQALSSSTRDCIRRSVLPLSRAMKRISSATR